MDITPPINLATKRNNFVDKFISWALNIGRVIIILTEAIALCAFLYRFSLDRKLIDLKDQITTERAYVQSWKDQEIIYRSLQDHLSLIKKLSYAETKFMNSFFYINNAIDTHNILTDNLYFSKDTVRIQGSSKSITYLTQLIDNLKRDTTDIEAVSLDNLENRTSTATIAFNITIVLKPN